MKQPAQTADPDSPTLSVIIITLNEADNIAACLDSVAFAVEWIVVDSGSTDSTCEIARDKGARVVQTDDWHCFGPQKNRALGLATGGWVLYLDSVDGVLGSHAVDIWALTH